MAGRIMHNIVQGVSRAMSVDEVETQPLRILVVEDDDVDFRMMRRLLEPLFDEPVRIDRATTFGDATDAISNDSHDIYFVDYRLGGENGLDLIKHVGGDDKHKVIILVTGQENRDVDIAAAQLGAADYLIKAELSATRLERSLRYAREMVNRRKALQRQADDLLAANELVEARSEKHLRLANSLVIAQTELKQALDRAEESEAKYKQLAQHDMLTGVANRALFGTCLERGIVHTQRSGKQLALLMLDLDRFKVVNDTYGHPVGDALLKKVADKLMTCVRTTDTVARLGGDEFAVIATNLNHSNGAAEVAAKIVQLLGQPITIDGRLISTATSIGIAMLDSRDKDAEQLLQEADAALYQAKQNGRGAYRFFDGVLDQEVKDRKALEADLGFAVARDELFLEYQPKIDLHDGRVTGVEALVRWRHPTRGVIPPGRFIPLAEANGNIQPMARWIIHAACRQAAAWRDSGRTELPVAINLSPLQFRDETLVAEITAATAEAGIPPSMLELEITETVIIDDFDAVVRQLHQLRNLGITITIDDFGAGYSSLALVKHLPADCIKVDRTFVANIPHDSKDVAIVKSVIALANNLDLNSIGEGVETEQQQRFLANLGCREAQGFHIAKPRSATGLVDWLNAHCPIDTSSDQLIA